MKDYDKELFKANRKAWLKMKLRESFELIKENPQLIPMIGAAAGLISNTVVKDAIRSRRARAERNELERRFYDRSIGCYYMAKRVPTPNEKLEIARRKKNGENVGAVLRSMGLY